MQTIRNYWNELTASVGSGWNRFWFTPVDPAATIGLRVLVGIAACYFLVSHAFDLVVWFGHDGLLPVETVRQLSASGPDGTPAVRWSYLYYSESPSYLWMCHILGLLAAIAFTLGLFTRITSVLTLVTMLAYIHRAPMITGPFEPILSMLLFCLCVAPCGSRFSLDRFLGTIRKKNASNVPASASQQALVSVSANISVRMMQVHLCALYLMMGLTKLAGETWWRGDAIWWLAASTESCLVDLSALHGYPLLINFWTHSVVVFELLFAVMIWQRLARPLLLCLAVPMWFSVAVVTGQVSFCGLMLIANLCFMPSQAWHSLGIAVPPRDR